MIEKSIRLSTVELVKDFVNVISDFDFEVDLLSGRYCVNGKSIMGIFSLDLTKPIQMKALVPEEQQAAFLESVGRFEVL